MQVATSDISLTEGERYISDRLTKELKPSEPLVQDVSASVHVVSSLQFRFVLIDAFCGLCDPCFVCACALCLGGCGPFYAITIANEKLKGHSILKQH